MGETDADNKPAADSASQETSPPPVASRADLTSAYIETGVLYRHFGSRRSKLFLSYWITVAAVAVAYVLAWTNPDLRPLACIVLGVGCMLTLVYWALELRHRQISSACLGAASKIEEGLGLTAEQGAYTRLRKLPSAEPAHGQTMNWMYLVSALGFLAGTIYALRWL